ncbi:MAG: hotdog fold thioesterase [Bacteroidota bacterium]
MKIWRQPFDLDLLHQMGTNTLGDILGMRFTDFGDDYLVAEMPVDHRTVQPMRLLHGGASVALAETLGSVASLLCVEDITKKAPVGIEINANHLRSVREGGKVTGTARPIRIGRSIHVWQIDIKDERDRLVCTSRLTTMVVDQQ